MNAAEALETRQLLTIYAIDPVNGDDTNPGTLESPFRTPRNLSYSTADGNANAILLQAGDTVYLRDGVHDWSGLLNDVSNDASYPRAAFLLLGVHGTESSPITIQAYPGERPIVTGREAGIENDLIYVLQSSHVRILGLEVTGAFGNGIRVTATQEVEVAYNHVHNNDGLAHNNMAGIYSLATIGLHIHHNLVHDNYDREGARIIDETIYPTQNSRNIAIFGDESDRVRVHHNKVFNTPLASGATTGAGIWVKHASEIPNATLEFHDNIVRDVFHTGIGGQSAGIHVHHNLIENAGPYLILGGSNVLTEQVVMERIRLHNNTFMNTTPVEIFGLDDFNYPDSGFMEFRNNIVSTNVTSYNSEDGIVRLEIYGTDDEYQALVKPQNLQFSGNVYHNTPASPLWNAFSANGGEFGTLGGSFTFTQWQALGIDASSVVADPQLDSNFAPQNSVAADAGWLAGSEPRLVMFVKDDLFSETDGQNASFVTLFRSGTSLSQSLTVSLSVSDPTEISVPASATFPAGVSRIQIPITALDDNQVEATRAVRIQASTVSGLSGSEWVRVLQKDVSTTLDSPTIIAPASTTQALRPAFSWTAVSGATSYDIKVDNLSTGVMDVISTTIADTTYVHTADLEIGRFRVAVRSRNSSGTSAWTVASSRIQTAAMIAEMSLEQPTNRPPVAWSILPGAVKYDLWVNNVSTGQSQVIRQQNLTGTSFTPTQDLPPARYRAWIRGIDAAGAAASWSAAVDFIVSPPGGMTSLVLIDEDFEDGSTDGFDELSPDNNGRGSSARIVNGYSAGSGSHAFAITYAEDEYEAKLQKYNLVDYEILDVEFTNRLPDAIPVENSGTGFAGLKLSRLFRSSGLPAGSQLQVQLDYFRADYDYPGSPASYSVSFYLVNGERVLRVPLDFSPDRWFRIHYRAKMNTPGQSNGELTVWLDGVEQGQMTGLNYGDTVDERPDGMWVGGNFSYHGVNPDHPFRRLIDDVKLTVWTTTQLSPPELSPPASPTVNQRPTIQWSAVPGAVRYEVSIDNLTTNVMAVVQGSVTSTSFIPSSDLGIGRMRVRVRAIDSSGGQSDWSVPIAIRVNTPVVLNAMAAPQTTLRPQISWNALTGATKYDLWVDHISGGQSQIIRQPELTSTSFTPSTDLPLGRYRAWVRGIDAAGHIASWSTAVDFTVAMAPEPTSPLAGTFARQPTFAWSAIHGAASYDVYVRNQVTGVTDFYPRGITTTSWTPSELMTDGPYRWWVQAVGPANFRSLWSPPIDIYIGGRPDVLGPTGTTSNRTPTFTWTTIAGAESYQLWVSRIDVVQPALINRSGLTTASFTPVESLAAGVYRIWVRAISTSGEWSPWSPSVTVTITATSQTMDPDINSETGLEELLATSVPGGLYGQSHLVRQPSQPESNAAGENRMAPPKGKNPVDSGTTNSSEMLVRDAELSRTEQLFAAFWEQFAMM